MAINKDGARRAIRSAEREFKSASMSFENGDWVGTLKYLQECMEYAAKAVLIAYGVDYPKIHSVGRFMWEIRDRYPRWFMEQAEWIGELTDGLARRRPNFRYPYEHPPEEHAADAGDLFPKVKNALDSCCRLIRVIFR